jgi:hypothetical protein
MDLLAEFKDGREDMLLDYTALHGDRHEHRLDEPHRAAKQDLQNRLSVRQQRDIETLAVTSIDPDEVFRMFRLTREVHPPDYWKVNHWERRPVSPQLGKSNVPNIPGMKERD